MGVRSRSSESKLVSLSQYFRYASRSDKLLLVIGTLGAMGNGTGLPLLSLFFGDLLDSFSTSADVLKEVQRIALIFVVIGICTGIGGWLQTSCWRMASLNQSMRIRKIYLEAILRKNMTWFDTRTVAEISAQMDSDIKILQEGMSEKVANVIQHNSTFITGVILGFTYGWQLTLIIFACIPLLVAGGALMSFVLSSSSAKSQKAYSKAGSAASEILKAISTVCAFTNERKEIERYESKINEAKKVGIRKSVLSGIMLGYFEFILFCTYGISLWYGARLIRLKVINPATDLPFTGGDIVTIFFSVLLGSIALGQAAPNYPAIVSGRSAAARIFRIIDNLDSVDTISESNSDTTIQIADDKENESSEQVNLVPLQQWNCNPRGMPEAEDGETLSQVDGSIEFREIDFAYPTRSDVAVFEKMSLSIEKGTTVALVGESGSGKSTCVGLLQRFYEPLGGMILLDGHDISKLNIHWLRQQIGVVSQMPVLFSGTIEDNIRIGKPSASMEEIIDAARLANAHDFIEGLPEGYLTYVSGSSQLSGGQKQRIAIARAIIKSPKILLLDEATAALDNHSEKIVQKALENVMGNCTTLVIAHRLSTIRNADKICVFQKGKLVEQGTHQELIDLGGHYKTMVAAQGLSASSIDENEILEKETGDEVEEVNLNDHDVITRAESFSISRSLSQSLPIISSVDATKVSQTLEDSLAYLSTKENIHKRHTSNANFVRVFQLLSSFWWILLLGCIGSAGIGFVWPGYSLFLSEMIAVFYETDPNEQQRKSFFWMLAFFAIAVAIWIAEIVQNSAFGFVGESLTYILRSKTFRSLISQEMGWFDIPGNHPDILCSRLATDAEQVRSIVVDRLSITIQSLFTMTIGLCIAFFFGWQLSLSILGMIPLFILSGIVNGRLLGGGKKTKDAFVKANAISSEAISEIKTIKSFNREDAVIQSYESALSMPLDSESKDAIFSGFGPGMTNFVLFSMYGCIFYIGSVFVDRGYMNFTDVLRVFFTIVVSFMMVGQVIALAPDASRANSSMEIIFEMIDRKPQIDGMELSKGVIQDLSGLSIRFEKVKFSYPARPEAQVLKELSIEVPSGTSLALVGPSGSGKSSCISLLQRFYDYEGRILIGDVELRDFNVRNLRHQIAVVSQEPALFDGSIRENILYGNPDASEEDLQRAIDQANLTDFLTKLEGTGIDTLIGSKGIQLSGGQRQRVAIARAILKNPKILLLDEATSALDPAVEKLVQSSLNSLMVGRTSIVIAHRLSTIKDSDCIAVMDSGKIIEAGTHEELIQKDGAYANLVKLGEAGKTSTK